MARAESRSCFRLNRWLDKGTSIARQPGRTFHPPATTGSDSASRIGSADSESERTGAPSGREAVKKSPFELPDHSKGVELRRFLLTQSGTVRTVGIYGGSDDGLDFQAPAVEGEVMRQRLRAVEVANGV